DSERPLSTIAAFASNCFDASFGGGSGSCAGGGSGCSGTVVSGCGAGSASGIDTSGGSSTEGIPAQPAIAVTRHRRRKRTGDCRRRPFRRLHDEALDSPVSCGIATSSCALRPIEELTQVLASGSGYVSQINPRETD